MWLLLCALGSIWPPSCSRPVLASPCCGNIGINLMSHFESGPVYAKFRLRRFLRGSGEAHKNTSNERGATRANQPWETRHQHRHRHPNATSPTKLGSSPARKYAAAAPRPSRLVTSAWFSRARVSALCAFRVSAVPTMLSTSSSHCWCMYSWMLRWDYS